MATANKSGNLYLKLVPIMLSFFAMSFVDLVGTGTNFIKKDFGLSDTMAGLFPLMVFLWFLIFSVPTGLMIMGLFGGAVFALPMGMAADSLGSQAGALAVMMIGVLYLLFFTKKIRTNR